MGFKCTLFGCDWVYSKEETAEFKNGFVRIYHTERKCTRCGKAYKLLDVKCCTYNGALYGHIWSRIK